MLNDKKLDKMIKILGDEVVTAMSELDANALELMIVKSESNMKVAQEELEANEKYQALKEDLKAMSQGLREVRKFQLARIYYSLHLLEQLGK